jgi:DNA modification methylase
MSVKLKIETWPLERVLNYARNARMHSDEQVKAIAASITEFGFINPCLVDADGVLIAGHGRVLACRHLGLNTVPVIQVGHLTEIQIKALRIADNQLPQLATWNADLLRLELTELSAAGYDMPLLGFDQVQLVSFLSVPSGADPERTPEPPTKPVTKLGDVWIMGKHRLICGDSTDAETVASVLNGKKPHLMVTDPPYGVEYDPEWRADANKWKGSKVTIGGKAMGKVSNDEFADWRKAWANFPGDVVYVWHGGLRSVEQAEGLEAEGFVIRSQIIWNKGRLVISRGDYHWQHEACWYGVKKGKTGHWNGSRTESTVWDIAKPQSSETGHSTQKPIECMRRPIINNSKPGDYVYEPFSGSGTTLIACQQENRYCLAIELNPAYVDVAVQRWMEFSKGDAVLESTGQKFDEVRKARLKNGSMPKLQKRKNDKERKSSPSVSAVRRENKSTAK